MTPEYLTTDFFLASFLVHKGATLRGLRRLGPKKVEFRFQTGEHLHGLLRLYWSGNIVPVIPWEMFLCYHRLKCLSIDRYDPLPGPASPETPTSSSSPAPDANQ
jgi:hypothetical protein